MATSGGPMNSWPPAPLEPPAGGPASLVDRLIDSQLDWRRLVGEANGGRPIGEHLGEAQIKRQEVLHELIQTERHHCLTLALMRQIYLSGLQRLNEARGRLAGAGSRCPEPASQPTAAEPIDLERLFPALEELIQSHELFFAHLRLRLVDCCQPRADRPLVGVVGPVGDLLADQFRLRPAGAPGEPAGRAHPAGSGAGLGPQTTGRKLLAAYARFCGQQNDSTRYFKQLIQSDKQFKQFIEVSTLRPSRPQPPQRVRRPVPSLELSELELGGRRQTGARRIAAVWPSKGLERFPSELEEFVNSERTTEQQFCPPRAATGGGGRGNFQEEGSQAELHGRVECRATSGSSPGRRSVQHSSQRLRRPIVARRSDLFPAPLRQQLPPLAAQLPRAWAAPNKWPLAAKSAACRFMAASRSEPAAATTTRSFVSSPKSGEPLSCRWQANRLLRKSELSPK